MAESSIARGNFVIKNSKGDVTLAGLATLSSDVMSAAFSDDTELNEHRDAGNVPRTITEDFRQYSVRLRLTPGIGSALASVAAVKAAIASLKKMDSIVLANFADAQLNWDANAKGHLAEVGKTLEQGSLLSLEVTARRFVALEVAGGNVTETPINFSGNWEAV